MMRKSLFSKTVWAAFVFACLAVGFAQSTPAEDFALTLRTDALAVEEPLGTIISCSPYEALFPEQDLSCFRLALPLSILRARFERYFAGLDGYAWSTEWETIEVPSGVEAGRNESVVRTLTGPDGREYRVAIFDLRRSRDVLVATELEPQTP